MVKFEVIFVAILAMTQAAMVRREAKDNALADLEKHAAEFQKTFTERFQAMANSKNTEELNKALKEGSDSVLQQLSSFSNSLQGVLNDANGKAKEAFEKTRVNIQKTADELRKSHPEVEQQAGALRDKLNAAVQNTVQESQKLAKELGANLEQANKELAPKFKAAYDDFIKNAEELQKKIHEAATKQ